MRGGSSNDGPPRAQTLKQTVPLTPGPLVTVGTFRLLAPVTFAKASGSANLSIDAASGAVSAAMALQAGATQTLSGEATAADGCVIPFTVTLTGAAAPSALWSDVTTWNDNLAWSDAQ